MLPAIGLTHVCLIYMSHAVTQSGFNSSWKSCSLDWSLLRKRQQIMNLCKLNWKKKRYVLSRIPFSGSSSYWQSNLFFNICLSFMLIFSFRLFFGCLLVCSSGLQTDVRRNGKIEAGEQQDYGRVSDSISNTDVIYSIILLSW